MSGIDLRRPAPYEAVVDCGGLSHRLRWDGSGLEALDHGDTEGERALAALAGERCVCIDALEAWAAHADDLRVLLLASRGPGDELNARQSGSSGGWISSAPLARGASGGQRSRAAGSAGASRTPAVARFVAPAARSSAARNPAPPASGPARRSALSQTLTVQTGSGHVTQQGRVKGKRTFGVPLSTERGTLRELMALDAGLAARLAATVATTWSARIAEGDARVPGVHARLVAALYGRVVPAVRRWLVDPTLTVEVDMVAPDAELSIARTDDGVRVALPFEWVASVSSRGLSVLLDRFVLAADGSSQDTLTLYTVATDLGDVLPIVLSGG